MSKYFSIDGNATRSEYWGVNIVAFIAMFILAVVGMMLVGTNESVGLIIGGLMLLVTVVLYIWVYLAVAIKRCRDAGINTWWTASTFIPYVGFIPFIVIGCLASAPAAQNA